MFGVAGRELRECNSRNWRLEIDTAVEGDRSIATRSGDAAKTGGINVRRWVAPYRPVQRIDSVGPNSERFVFSYPYSLAQCEVQAE